MIVALMVFRLQGKDTSFVRGIRNNAYTAGNNAYTAKKALKSERILISTRNPGMNGRNEHVTNTIDLMPSLSLCDLMISEDSLCQQNCKS